MKTFGLILFALVFNLVAAEARPSQKVATPLGDDRIQSFPDQILDRSKNIEEIIRVEDVRLESIMPSEVIHLLSDPEADLYECEISEAGDIFCSIPR